MIKQLLNRNKQLNEQYLYLTPYSHNRLYMNRFKFFIFKLKVLYLLSGFSEDIEFRYHWLPSKINAFILDFDLDLTIDFSNGIDYIRIKKDLDTYRKLNKFVGKKPVDKLPDEEELNVDEIMDKLNKNLKRIGV